MIGVATGFAEPRWHEGFEPGNSTVAQREVLAEAVKKIEPDATGS